VSSRRSTLSQPGDRVRRSLLQILGENVLCAVSTVGAGGRAHVHICYFAFSPDLRLLFISDPRSRHAANLRRHRSAAVAVFSSVQTWGGPDRGVQLFGTCALIPPAGTRAAWRVYQERFPDSATHRSARKLALYQFLTRRVTLLDEREFGDGVLVQLPRSRLRG
jgi:uncharacterized protein YhbP (UPF0306 family)